MTQITQQQLESWEQQVQDTKAELEWGNQNQEDMEESIVNALDFLTKLEQEIWLKKIEPEPIKEEPKTKKRIKVSDYNTGKTYFI